MGCNMSISSIVVVIFWLSLCMILYIHLAYPFILMIISVFQLKLSIDKNHNADLPHITLFIPAYNEENVISKKIENALNIDYPEHLLEIVVASDGSVDETNDIIRSFESKGITPFISDQNLGKNAIINTFIPKTRGEILVFTDSNAMFSADALRHLARAFDNPKVGCVGGRLRYLSGNSAVARGEGLYFRYENLLRKWEGRLGRSVGANGAIYAIRRELFEPVPGHVPNDFYHPLIVLRKGYDSTFAPDAIAYEKPTERQGEEFNRRMRIVARSVAAIPATLKIAGSYSAGAWFSLFSHKILRWLGFPILMLNLLANIYLAGQPFFLALFVVQLTFYICGTLGYWGERVGFRIKALYIPYYFLLINIACFFGIIQWLVGKRITKWQAASTTR